MNDRAVLPARFGTTFADEAAITASLVDRADRLKAALEQVRDRVEIGVRALWKDHEPAEAPAGATGREYLQNRLDTRRRAERLAGELHAPLSERAVAAHHKVLPTPRQVLTASYLVEQGGVASFVEQVDALARRHPDALIICTGPWPPHSFVTD